MKALTNAIYLLDGHQCRQPYWGLQYVLMNVQAFLLGKLKVV